MRAETSHGKIGILFVNWSPRESTEKTSKSSHAAAIQTKNSTALYHRS